MRKKRVFLPSQYPIEMAKETIPAPVAAYSLLAAGTSIIGDIHSDSDLRLDGKMEGNIESQGKVIIGSAATLKGNIRCVNAEISGYVKGDVDAPDQLTLRGQSKIDGSIRTATLIIEPGASFNGSCEMVNDSTAE
jgi:cytoskeletal protein CcmA (bactofilin family)